MTPGRGAPGLGRAQRLALAELAAGPLTTEYLASRLGVGEDRARRLLQSLRTRRLADNLGQSRGHRALWRLVARTEPRHSSPGRDLEVLTALEQLGRASVPEIATRSGWHRSSVRRALRELEIRELARPVRGSGGRWRVG